MKNFSAVLVCVALLVLPSRVSAMCECMVDPVEAVESGAYVLRGEVKGLAFLDPLLASNEPRIVVDLRVIDSWTAIGGTALRLHTIYNRYSCEGYWFRQDSRYLLVIFPNARHERVPSEEWPPQDTLGVLHCGVWAEDDWETVIQRLDSSYTRVVP